MKYTKIKNPESYLPYKISGSLPSELLDGREHIFSFPAADGQPALQRDAIIKLTGTRLPICC